MKTLDAKLVADLHDVLEGWSDAVAFGVGLDGAIYASAHRAHESLVVQENGATFPKSRFDEPTDYLIVRWKDGELRKIVARETIAVRYVQPYPNGVLLVGARCVYRQSGPEQNAVAIDWSGREIARFTLGDGIADVRTTSDAIWVSFFDEGVFGNYGWNKPLGEDGLVSFDLHGEKRWAYDAAAARTGTISDAYALNVAADDDVWVYFYTDFPIVRIHRGAYQSWGTGEAGANALAVHSNRVLLAGDYKNSSRARIARLGGGDREELVLRDHHGTPFDRVVYRGVGERLYAFAHREVSVIRDW